MLMLKCVSVAIVLVACIAWPSACDDVKASQRCLPPQRTQGSSLLQVVASRTKTHANQTQPMLKALPSASDRSHFGPRGVQQSLASLDIIQPTHGGSHYGSRTLEVTTMVLLLVLLSAAAYLWFEKRFSEDSIAGTSSTLSARASREYLDDDDILMMGEEVHSVPCDYMMVLISATPSHEQPNLRRQRTTPSVHQLIHPLHSQIVPGLEMAKAAFLDPLRHSFKSEEMLQERFSEEMTFESYAAEARELLAEMLKSNGFGVELEPFKTPDKDKICWRLRLPSLDAVAQYAAHYHYRTSLSDAAYEQAQMPVPGNGAGDDVYAFLPYMPKWAAMYRKFRQADRLKLLHMRIDRHVNLHALRKQNVLIQFFAAHSLQHVNVLCSKWANLRRSYRFPKFAHIEDVRDYFGERIGFLFLWQRYYMSELLVPAVLGGIVFWRRFVLPEHMHNLVQIGFAMVMAFWAPIFNARYARFEARTRQRWGMDGDHTAIHVRHAYKAKLDGGWQVMIAPILGDVLAVCMVLLSVLGIHVIQNNRATQSHLGVLHGVFVALQILTLDAVWQVISRYITRLENHRLKTAWWDSWIRKMLPVRIFTNLYPFIFVGFLKKHTAEGCPKTNRGCLDELQSDLCIYFAMTITKDIGRDGLLIAYSYVKLVWDRGGWRRTDENESRYMFLQVQAQMYSYDDWLFMDDWTRQVTTFLLLVCFNVVLPVIGVFVLLTTMIEARLLAHRTCCLLQRPVPASAPGIGAWQSVLEVMEVIGVLVTVSFAIFVMNPIAEKPILDKFILFFISEHVLLVVNLLVKSKYPRTPHDVQDIAEYNDSMVNRHFIDVTAHGIEIEAKADPPG